MINHDQAVSFLTTLLQSRVLPVSGQDILKKLYLHGSTSEHERGRDIDIVLEVDSETFKRYCSRCNHDLDGVNPVAPHFLFGAFWDNPATSPKGLRTKWAFEIIGFDIESFLSTSAAGKIRLKNLDAICLPEGWCDRSSGVSRDLHEKLKKSGDHSFLIHAIRSKLEITIA